MVCLTILLYLVFMVRGGARPEICIHLQMDLWAQLYEDTDALTQDWLRHGARLLHDCTAAAGQPARRVQNVLVSSGQLVATLGKLLLFRLDGFFPIHSAQIAVCSPIAENLACFVNFEDFHLFNPGLHRLQQLTWACRITLCPLSSRGSCLV